MKRILALALLCMTFATPGYCDLFGDRTDQRLKAVSAEESESKISSSFIDSGSIADYLAALAGKLGVKEGVMFDMENEEIRNYLATTLYTMPEGVAFNVGMIGTDGVIGSIDYNIGAAISQNDVPLIGLFEYLYIGYGAGWMDPDGEDTNIEEAGDWEFVHGPTVVFKATF